MIGMKRWIVVALIVSVISLQLFAMAQDQESTKRDEVRVLELDKPSERELVGEQAHLYVVQLLANEFLHVTVLQRGVDVVVTVYAPGEKKLMDVDSPNGDTGPEEVYLIGDTAGTYRLEVRSLEKGAAGKYVAILKEKRLATAADRELVVNQTLAKQAKDLIDQADSLRQNGRYDEGIQKGERGLALFERALGPEQIETANALNSLGLLYEFNGDYTRAERAFQRAQGIFEKRLGAEHPAVAATLQNLAGVADAKGDLRLEEQLLARSLEMYSKALGPEDPQVGISLNLLGRLYYNMGQYPKAGQLYERALAIEEKALPPQHPEVAFVIQNLAELSKAEGDYSRAESLFRRALAIREQALGPLHPDLAYSLHELAELYSDKGDFVQSEVFHQRALAIREKALGPDHPDVANSVNHLAVLYFAKGDYGRAEGFMRRALSIYEKAFGEEHREVATDLDNLGALYRERGDFAQAEALHHRALAIYEKVLGPQHPEVAISLNHLALSYDAGGDYARAVEFLARGQEVSEHNLSLVLTTGSERQKQLYVDTLSVQTDYAVSLHLRSAPMNEQAAQLALTTILRRKGRALDAMTDQLATVRRHAAPQDQALLDQLVRALSYLATLQIFGEGKLSPAARSQEIDKTRTEVETLQREISSRSTEFRAESKPVTLQAVRQAIPSNAVLVEFFSYQPYNVKAREGERLGAHRYVAYVVRRDIPTPQFVELGDAGPIDAAVEQLRSALRNPASGDLKGLAREVYRRVMQSVLRLCGKTRHVFLAPDGALNLIPFDALADEKGNYLIETYSFSYLTSGRDLLRLQERVESRSAPMVIANPLYDMAAPGLVNTQADRTLSVSKEDRPPVDSVFLNFKPLPGTAEEAAALASLMPDARVLTRDAATEAALKGVDGPSILHIATHGFFLVDQRQALRDRNGPPRGTSDTFDKSPPSAHWENPLLRSGLVLAGVKQRQSGNGQDGVLTALEVAGLNLWGTKLVVLSACETGLGEVRYGEGVYGLRRALVLAGSETQVMSLWKVSDAGTRDLMTAYYTRLQKGEGRAEALRQVQLMMLRGQLKAGANTGKRGMTDTGEKVVTKDYRHPYYWAAFIQSGDWRSMDGK